jgi:hypothetical protein
MVIQRFSWGIHLSSPVWIVAALAEWLGLNVWVSRS